MKASLFCLAAAALRHMISLEDRNSDHTSLFNYAWNILCSSASADFCQQIGYIHMTEGRIINMEDIWEWFILADLILCVLLSHWTLLVFCDSCRNNDEGRFSPEDIYFVKFVDVTLHIHNLAYIAKHYALLCQTIPFICIDFVTVNCW